MADGPFKLSAQLLGHEADVRDVSFPSPDLVLSASRDGTVRAWSRTQTSPPTFEGSLVSRGTEFINALAFFPATKEHPDGLVVSGGKDTIIEVKSPKRSSSDNAERLLIGHANNVCTIDVFPGGKYIVSGGWDGQARVWNLQNWETELTLGGHEGKAVWSVLAIDETTVATACADKSVRVFDLNQASGGEVMPRSTIYTPDVVRALCKVPANHPSGADIASASNDGIIRLWKVTGQQVAELHGHDSFIYSLVSLPSGELVSSGEDRTVRVWRGSECVQTITHPAISVWTVAVNPETGNIVTGASDGVGRIFTRQPDAVADAETLKEFDDAVKGSAIPQQQMGQINKEKLPGPEFLTTKSGTKEGQVQMIKEDDGSITAHTWSAIQQQWTNVGTVVDAVGSTGKKVEYQGQSYDFVFDVDIEEGKPPLKLPYNLSENPYERATKFLGDNELPVSYLDQVASFITQNTQGATLGDQTQSGGSDRFGTESRYRPGDAEKAQKPKVLPQTEYLSISAAKYDAIFNKIININKTMIASGRKDVALNPGEVEVLGDLRSALEASKAIPPRSIELVIRIVSSWDYADRLAGLDLLRCIARHHVVAQLSTPQFPSLIHLTVTSALPPSEGETAPNENAVMMGIRVIANIFATADGRSLANSQAEVAISFLERVVGARPGSTPIGKFNRNVLIASSTAALNYAVLVSRERLLTPKLQQRLFSVIGAVLADQTDAEVLYRGIVALGTLFSASPRAAGNLDLKGWLKGAAERGSDDRILNVANETSRLLG